MTRWLTVVMLGATSVALAETPSVSFADARTLLARGRTTECSDIPCLISEAYAKDVGARDAALELFRTTGSVAGTGPEEIMDGGYRGKIKLVPQLPLGPHRKHLTWTADAMTAIDTFFAQLMPSDVTPNYRWRALQLRFVRSPGKRTPSAYAFGWSIEYNVNGSLLTSSAGVLETLFHELFHTNDFAHATWSDTALQKDYDAIVKRCGTKGRCLDPYAPNTTKVRSSGTYYAFQPNNGNGVHEYAAELAVRYFREQTQMLRDSRLAKPAFKCGPVENRRAWAALTAEFFGGVDLVPPCTSP